MEKHKLSFAESSENEKEVLLTWDKNHPDKKRVAWKITKVADMFYAVIEYIDKTT